MTKTQKKRCSKCGLVKPKTDFHKNKRAADGLVKACKSCTKAYVAGVSIVSEEQTKKCSKCGIAKPARDFHKNKAKSDGLSEYCKQCESLYKKLYNKFEVTDDQWPGIKTWEQIKSVLREMAELQWHINTENTLCKKRIALIKNYSQEAIEPYQNHQIALQSMLETFLKKNCAKSKTTIKNFRFGSVHFCRGKVGIKLNIELAGKSRGKP